MLDATNSDFLISDANLRIKDLIAKKSIKKKWYRFLKLLWRVTCDVEDCYFSSTLPLNLISTYAIYIIIAEEDAEEAEVKLLFWLKYVVNDVEKWVENLRMLFIVSLIAP